MAILQSYELNGNKLSFANWISNLSPVDTPFVSMTGKESIDQTMYQWQTDKLSRAASNAQVEGSDATDAALAPTMIHSNFTQILRRVTSVSDTTTVLSNYGRGKELQYQLEKMGKELKRDLESMFLTSDQMGSAAAAGAAGKVSCYQKLIAAQDTADADTGAIVHTETAAEEVFAEADIFNMTYQLYLAGAKANTIMFHPKHVYLFSNLMKDPAAATQTRFKMFDGLDTKFNVFVNSIKDPLGQEFKLVPNRFMPEDYIYFFNPSDWTQMVLRAPEKTKLSKNGSSEKWMIEMEVGLRHRHPYASGALKMKPKAAGGGGSGLPLTAASEGDASAAPAPKTRSRKAS